MILKKEVDVYWDLNKLRSRLARKKHSNVSKLPHCEDSFHCHFVPASYQTKIWKLSVFPNPVIGSQKDYGWEDDVSCGGYQSVQFSGPTASESLNGLFCTCSSKNLCRANRCICFQQNMPCIELCSCQGEEKCNNPIYISK